MTNWLERGQVSKRVWVQNVHVSARLLKGRLEAAQTRIPSGDKRAERIAHAVDGLLDAAVKAATRRDPVPGRIANWWRGTLIEAA
jgi:hypothetical protein